MKYDKVLRLACTRITRWISFVVPRYLRQDKHVVPRWEDIE
jgi:hypothetical protein